jgi:prophage regulatory protein
MLLKIPNLSPLNYYLIATNVHQKYKELKGQEPSKKQCVTRISVISFYTALFTSVIINSYNRILKTSDKDYKLRSDIPSLISPTNKLRKRDINPYYYFIMSLFKLLRLSQVVEITSLSKSTIYRMIKSNEFPSPLQIGSKSVAWRQIDLEKWMKNLPEVPGGEN